MFRRATLRQELTTQLSKNSEWNTKIENGEVKTNQQEEIIDSAYAAALPLLQRYTCGTYKVSREEMVDTLVKFTLRALQGFLQKKNAPVRAPQPASL